LSGRRIGEVQPFPAPTPCQASPCTCLCWYLSQFGSQGASFPSFDTAGVIRSRGGNIRAAQITTSLSLEYPKLFVGTFNQPNHEYTSTLFSWKSTKYFLFTQITLIHQLFEHVRPTQRESQTTEITPKQGGSLFPAPTTPHSKHVRRNEELWSKDSSQGTNISIDACSSYL